MTTAGAPPPTVRKLAVEVIDARDLIPKDGQGTSSPYVVVEFDGQRKRTRTVARELNPQWHERLDFLIADPPAMYADELDVEVYNDRRISGTTGGGARRNHFLGRVKIYGSQFSRRGEEGLIYFPLEKKSILSWIRGEIGLKIYYYDEPIAAVEERKSQPEPGNPQPLADSGATAEEEVKELPDIPLPSETAVETQSPAPPPHPIPVIVVEESPPLAAHVRSEELRPPMPDPEPTNSYPPEVMKMQMPPASSRISRRSNGSDYSSVTCPRVVSGRCTSFTEPVERVPASAFDLVEPMQYLFIRIVKARGLRPCESPYVKIRAGSHVLRSKPARADGSGSPEWNQVFSLSHAKPEPRLEISVWDMGPAEAFLGGVCFDLSDVPVRDQPDGGPLAPQWYRLEGGDDQQSSAAGGVICGDIMVSVWIGTQVDDSFPESWSTDAPYVSYTRSKVYQSPKLWYLRATVIEAQDLRISTPPAGVPIDVRVKIQLGFQSARTRRSAVNGSSSSFSWIEDMMFVASEPLDDQIIVLVEDRSMVKEPSLLGHVAIPVGLVEQRFDERQAISSRWFNLDGGIGIGNGNGNGGGPSSNYSGRVHLRLCLEGGYHVLDEAAHVCSDFRPTAKQLWKPAIGSLELGIVGARGLLPMKTKGGAKGSTDAYCIAKYGKKWVRTRTITDSFEPRWNEQYTWQVYDPCTVLTVGVFDNWRMLADAAADRPDYRIGMVRIRVSTLESNRVYTASYPLLLLLRTGVKRMGELQVAVRFASPGMLPDTWQVYAQPMLPRMHYLRPIGVAQQEVLRGAAIRTVAAWLARSEPPLGPEVVKYLLDTDAHVWSMRRSKANWFRIMGVLAWAVGLARWVDGVRRWRNPVTTLLVHVLYLVLVWYPELVVPTAALYVSLIGVWYYRFRARAPPGMDARLSQAETADGEELDEEFDQLPSEKAPEVVRARYDRLRVLAGRVQRVMGDFAAQGERVQALVSWRDPRATRIFIGVCMAVAVVMYVVPPKMVAVALGFYLLRHPMFRDPMPPAGLNFFRRLPSVSDRLL